MNKFKKTYKEKKVISLKITFFMNSLKKTLKH